MAKTRLVVNATASEANQIATLMEGLPKGKKLPKGFSLWTVRYAQMWLKSNRKLSAPKSKESR